MPKFRLTLRDQTIPTDKMSRYIKAIIEGIVEHPVQVSPGAWSKDGATYLIESRASLNLLGLKLLLRRYERRMGKVQSLEPVSKRWALKMRAPSSKNAMEAAQLFTRAHKTLGHETLMVNGRNITLVVAVDDNVDSNAIKGLVLDTPGIDKTEFVEAVPK